jgi:hypothetical protein
MLPTTGAVICVTNNPRWKIDGLEFVDGGAWEVFIRARDLVHKGWKFLAHPLYGNLNPARRPYRTLLLESPGPDDLPPDTDSLSMIEGAIESCRDAVSGGLLFAGMDESILRDFAILDCELMKDAVGRYCGQIRLNQLGISAGRDVPQPVGPFL